MAKIQGNGVDVSVRNPRDFIYVKGDEFTDGSLRLIPDIIDATNVEFQLRTAGVWNDTGIQIAASTVHLGRDLELSGAGDFLRTHDINLDIDALTPHIEFTDSGTSLYVHAPVLTTKQFDQVIQSDFSVDNVAAIHGSTNIVPIEILGTAHRAKTGATAATENVTISHYHGSDNTGILFWTKNFPPSKFPANSDILIQLDGMAEAFANESIFSEFVSSAPFSLLGDSSGGPYTSWDFFPIAEEDLMSSTTGMDRVLVDASGATIADNAGNLILTGDEPEL